MKILFLLLSPAILMGQELRSEVLLNDQLKKYPIEKGSISYSISGDATGEEVFTFDRFGWRSQKKRSMAFELYGIESSQDQHEIVDGEVVFRLDPRDSTFRKRLDKRWSTMTPTMTPQQVSESILFSLGGSYNSDSTLQGKKCQVWIFENKKLQQMWIWNGLVLKRISMLGDKTIITTAVLVDLDIEVDDSIFIVPNIYTLKD